MSRLKQTHTHTLKNKKQKKQGPGRGQHRLPPSLTTHIFTHDTHHKNIPTTQQQSNSHVHIHAPKQTPQQTRAWTWSTRTSRWGTAARSSCTTPASTSSAAAATASWGRTGGFYGGVFSVGGFLWVCVCCPRFARLVDPPRPNPNAKHD